MILNLESSLISTRCGVSPGKWNNFLLARGIFRLTEMESNIFLISLVVKLLFMVYKIHVFQVG
jgi:hypothetical protein